MFCTPAPLKFLLLSYFKTVHSKPVKVQCRKPCMPRIRGNNVECRTQDNMYKRNLTGRAPLRSPRVALAATIKKKINLETRRRDEIWKSNELVQNSLPSQLTCHGIQGRKRKCQKDVRHETTARGPPHGPTIYTLWGSVHSSF